MKLTRESKPTLAEKIPENHRTESRIPRSNKPDIKAPRAQTTTLLSEEKTTRSLVSPTVPQAVRLLIHISSVIRVHITTR